MRRILHFPEEIIHHILSSLSTKEAARMSLVSKAWLRAWYSIPTLVFDQNDFSKVLASSNNSGDEEGHHNNVQEARQKYMNFVNYSLQRYWNQRLSIQKFGLHVTIIDNQMSSLLDEWIRIVVASRIEKLDLDIITSPELPIYSVPETIFTADLLTVLNLQWCNLCQLSTIYDGRLCSLQKLSLDEVHLSEGTIIRINFMCPLLEELTLKSCLGLENFLVYGLEKLKVVKIFQTWRVNRLNMVDVIAPSLQSFIYSDFGKDMQCEINLGPSPYLTYLCLRGAKFGSELFLEFRRKFPLLETLELFKCCGLRQIDIDNANLKNLLFHYCLHLSHASINAPRLRWLCYEGDTVPKFYSATSSGEGEASIRIMHRLNTGWFLRIRKFLIESSQFQVLRLQVSCENTTFNISLLDRSVVPKVFRVKRLELDIGELSSGMAALVDGLLWSCQPEYVHLLRWESVFETHFITLFYRILFDRDDANCCSAFSTKCWRHYLGEVEIETQQKNADGSLFWKSLSETSALEVGQPVRFRLDWLGCN